MNFSFSVKTLQNKSQKNNLSKKLACEKITRLSLFARYYLLLIWNWTCKIVALELWILLEVYSVNSNGCGGSGSASSSCAFGPPAATASRSSSASSGRLSRSKIIPPEESGFNGAYLVCSLVKLLLFYTKYSLICKTINNKL